MKRLITLALMTLLLAPVKVSAQIAAAITIDCGAETAPARSEAVNLHGSWDFVMDVGGTPNFGLLSIGRVGEDYGGSLALWQTAPVVLHKLAMAGNRFHMAVASREGDVLFDGIVSPKGDRLCGIVTYHGGRIFAAVAQRRPSTYQPQPPARPAPRR